MPIHARHWLNNSDFIPTFGTSNMPITGSELNLLLSKQLYSAGNYQGLFDSFRLISLLSSNLWFSRDCGCYWWTTKSYNNFQLITCKSNICVRKLPDMEGLVWYSEAELVAWYGIAGTFFRTISYKQSSEILATKRYYRFYLIEFYFFHWTLQVLWDFRKGITSMPLPRKDSCTTSDPLERIIVSLLSAIP